MLILFLHLALHLSFTIIHVYQGTVRTKKSFLPQKSPHIWCWVTLYIHYMWCCSKLIRSVSNFEPLLINDGEWVILTRTLPSVRPRALDGDRCLVIFQVHFPRGGKTCIKEYSPENSKLWRENKCKLLLKSMIFFWNGCGTHWSFWFQILICIYTYIFSHFLTTVEYPILDYSSSGFILLIHL